MIDNNSNATVVCVGLIKNLYPSAAIEAGSLIPQSGLKVSNTKTGNQAYDNFTEGESDHVVFFSKILNHAILYSSNFKRGTAEAFRNRYPDSKLTVFIPGDVSKDAATACKDLSISLVSKDQFKALASSL